MVGSQDASGYDDEENFHPNFLLVYEFIPEMHDQFSSEVGSVSGLLQIQRLKVVLVLQIRDGTFIQEFFHLFLRRSHDEVEVKRGRLDLESSHLDEYLLQNFFIALLVPAGN